MFTTDELLNGQAIVEGEVTERIKTYFSEENPDYHDRMQGFMVELVDKLLTTHKDVPKQIAFNLSYFLYLVNDDALIIFGVLNSFEMGNLKANYFASVNKEMLNHKAFMDTAKRVHTKQNDVRKKSKFWQGRLKVPSLVPMSPSGVFYYTTPLGPRNKEGEWADRSETFQKRFKKYLSECLNDLRMLEQFIDGLPSELLVAFPQDDGDPGKTGKSVWDYPLEKAVPQLALFLNDLPTPFFKTFVKKWKESAEIFIEKAERHHQVTCELAKSPAYIEALAKLEAYSILTK